MADSIDTRTAAGRLVLNVLLSVAQWEREAIGERTRDALQHKKRKNQRVGCVPFGKSLADDGITLMENDDETQAIQLIRCLRTEGYTLRAIATELESRGILNKAGKAKWIHTQIQKLLAKHAA